MPSHYRSAPPPPRPPPTRPRRRAPRPTTSPAGGPRPPRLPQHRGAPRPNREARPPRGGGGCASGGPPCAPHGPLQGSLELGRAGLELSMRVLGACQAAAGRPRLLTPSGAVSPRTDPCELARPLPAQRERRGEPRFEHGQPCQVTLAEEGGSCEPSSAQAAGCWEQR